MVIFIIALSFYFYIKLKFYSKKKKSAPSLPFI